LAHASSPLVAAHARPRAAHCESGDRDDKDYAAGRNPRIFFGLSFAREAMRAEETFMSMGRHLACVTIVLGFGVLASAAQAEDKITIGFVTHSQGDPFIQQIIDGAQAAANDLGVTLKVAQQQGAAPDGQLKLVQNIVNAGAQGVATSVPGDSMANSLNDIIASGVPVVQFNLLSAAVKAPYVGKSRPRAAAYSARRLSTSSAAPRRREGSS
jgi:basic membrane lipoprotein Med (substrate-binding protein (PBP1-ABC) superfamily)